MRRLLLVNALIFAVLAAAVTLVYYGYSYASSVASSDSVRDAMHEIAAEKVLNIEYLVRTEDEALFAKGLPLEDYLEKLASLSRTAHVRSVFVLDERGEVLPGGYYGLPRSEKESAAFREWFQKAVVPELGLAKLPPNTRDHLYKDAWAGPPPWGGKEYLFSFMKKVQGDRTHYVVIEEDLTYLVGSVFPQWFQSGGGKYIYQVTDANGNVVYGMPFLPDTDVLSATYPFAETVDLWFARVSEKDNRVREQLERRRLVDSLFIGTAITVIVVGFGFILLAIRRERRANELKSEFISNVSHELKTPLSIITMFGEMLANGRTKGPEQSTEYAEIIWRESVRLGRLIDNVLDFAKIERGKGVYEFGEADVGEVVERAVDLVSRRLTTASMTVDLEIEPELPLVKLDPNAFTLAVMNLIDNAIKYAADGKKIDLRLARETQGDAERIVLTVRDFGPGIDPEEQAQIFERFYRARAVRLKPIRGSGIGLALVRHIARAHGGDVEVTSVPGEGSTFRLWLPI